MPKTLHFNKTTTSAGQWALVPGDRETEDWLATAKPPIFLKPLTNAKQRSLSQNALMWKWYGEIANFMGDTIDWAHRFTKLYHGVPILRRDSEKFRKIYDEFIRPHDIPTKLVMIGLIDVTSALNTKQCSELCTTAIQYWAEKGLALTVPDQMFD